MKLKPFLIRTTIALSGTLGCTWARAHEGHGMPGIHHWHDTDVWGFVAVAALAWAGYTWFTGGRK